MIRLIHPEHGQWVLFHTGFLVVYQSEISKKNDNNLISDTDELLIIYNLEPEYDFSDDNLIIEKLKKSKFNIFFSSYITESISKYADIVFPLATQPRV